MKFSVISKRLLSLLMLVSILVGLFPTSIFAHTAIGSIWNEEADGDGILTILAIGDGYSEDTLAFAYEIATELGVPDIFLGSLCTENSTLTAHWANAKQDKAAYTYTTNGDGNWHSNGAYKMSEALTSCDWDYVLLQQAAEKAGVESTYNDDLTNLVSYVKQLCPNAKLAWNMTWAYAEGSDKLAASSYDDQLDMHHSTVSAVMNHIATNSDIDVIVPVSAAAQNIRTSLIGENICAEDGSRMGTNVGRYMAGATLIGAITGLDVWQCEWTAEDVPFAWQVIALESANNALNEPFAIINSMHDDVETSLLYDTAPTKAESGNSAYARIYPKWTVGGYWQSNNADTPTKVITNKDNSKYYWCTLRYTKGYLPVGSVILLSGAYKYRMDGWKSEATQSSRPGEKTDSRYVVTDSDWNGYTYRAFNISSTTANKDITGVAASTINSSFKIYYPVGEGKLENFSNYVRLKYTYYKNQYWYCTSADYYSRKVTSSDENNAT